VDKQTYTKCWFFPLHDDCHWLSCLRQLCLTLRIFQASCMLVAVAVGSIPTYLPCLPTMQIDARLKYQRNRQRQIAKRKGSRDAAGPQHRKAAAAARRRSHTAPRKR
jgi:hypothetical protein